jgi:hypothetical protein
MEQQSVLDKALKALNPNGVANTPLEPEPVETLPEEIEKPVEVEPELPLDSPFKKALPTEAAEGVIFELRPIPAGEIDQYWPKVEEGIKEVLFRSKGFYTFTPQEIWVFLHRKVAALYVGFLNGEYAGFGILRDMTDDFSQEPYLLSWLGQALSPLAKTCYYRDLETIAKQKGIKEIRHYSTRMGFDRKPPAPGWETVEICQRKVVE